MTINVGINGMGRIGRMVIRAIIESQNTDIKIKHINNRSNLEASCTLIKYDSVHGKFNAELKVKKDQMERHGETMTAEQEQAIRKPVLEKYEREGDPYYGSSRLWDDGIILPSETREVIGMALSATLNAPVERGDTPVFRM